MAFLILRQQWSNPSYIIFCLLLVTGGDIIQAAIAQLCGGSIPFLTPVVFSFGWVAYAFSSTLSAVGNDRLMPKPEVDCWVINAKTGYKRRNHSWVLSRILRDFGFWRDPLCDKVEYDKLAQLKKNAKSEAEMDSIRIGLRITVWSCRNTSDKPRADLLYWAGLGVVLVQLGIAAIPWALFVQSYYFFITIIGTILAFVSGALPQWQKEKFGVSHQKEKKDVFLTLGDGDHDMLLILGTEDGMDLEALASPYREFNGQQITRILSVILAMLWTALLITVAGYDYHTWYILLIGIIGTLYNVTVAGKRRHPRSFGIDLIYEDTIVDQKVMKVLWDVENSYPKAGAALMPEFFPGGLRGREQALWQYAEKRYKAHSDAVKLHNNAVERGEVAAIPTLWNLPPFFRPDGQENDEDIPEAGAYRPAGIAGS